MPAPVVLIFGSGANIGAALVKHFLAADYHVATVSRSPGASASTSDLLHIQADLSDPSAIPNIFTRLLSTPGWTTFPAVIIWNAYAASRPAVYDPTNPFAVADADFDRDWNLMVKSPFVAAREAVRAWTTAGPGGRKGTFIMTGNACPRAIITERDVPAGVPLANFMTLGVGKSGANFWLSNADEVFREKDIRFFFADERNADASAVGYVPKGDSHAEMFLNLVRKGDNIPSYATFVDGKYVKFQADLA